MSGIKVTFINMPIRERALPNTPPLGPALLSAQLRLSGADPSIIDLNAYRINDLFLTLGQAKKLIEKHFKKHGEPDIVGLSGLITTLKWQTEIAKIVKGITPNTFLVSGGGLATEIKETLFDWIPELDAVAIGEGEDIILEILNRDRKVYIGQPINNLDSLPLPAWDLLEEDANGFRVFDFYLANPVWGGSANNSSAAPFTMGKSMTTVSSRGCPYNCKFCYRGTQGQRNYRNRSARHLLREVEWLIEKYKVDFIGFNDDNFMVDKNRLAELIKLLGPLKIRWGTHGRLDAAADLKKIKLIAEAGCIYLGFGGESAHPEVLKNMGKGGQTLTKGTININGYDFPKTMVEGIQNSRQMGIHGNCTWIMGYPGETLQQLKTTVAFIKWQEEIYGNKNTVNKNMFIATAYPGTEMCKHPAVMQKLTENFEIKFDPDTFEPVYDENLRNYILQLEDATKVLVGPSGRPINFSAMPDKIFIQAKQYVETGDIFKILEM